MSGKIFAIRDGEGLTELTQTPYENEDLFQSLIEKHPEILAGEQINPENPRKWMLGLKIPQTTASGNGLA